jgi:hypothetical protein
MEKEMQNSFGKGWLISSLGKKENLYFYEIKDLRGYESIVYDR